MRTLALLICIFALLNFFSNSALAQEHIGFLNGNNVEITNLRGYVRVQCTNNNGYMYQEQFNCSGYIANPGFSDYFVHTPTVDADKVKLVSLREDGSKKTVNDKFDADKGQSKKRVNLAIWTLTQRPLLKDGENTISYELKKGSNVVKTGEFVARMDVVEERTCPTVFMSSHGPGYCDHHARVCDDYFERYNNCQ